jgi:cell division protein ZapA
MSKSLDVSIMGREFRIACPVGEEQALLDAVNYLDKKMSEIFEAGKVIGTERIAIMAALNIAHELLSARKPSGFDIEAFKRRMSLMQANVEQTLAEQDK